MDPDQLADPSVMSWQELVDELAKQAASDDLLGVLLMLLYCRSDEVNGRNSTEGLTPLEAALTAPLRRLDLRILVVELLLLHGADPNQALDNPLLTAPRALFDVVQQWHRGGRAGAHRAQDLLVMKIEDAEQYIKHEGLGLEHVTPPAAPLPADPRRPAPAPSHRGRSRSSSRHDRPDFSPAQCTGRRRFRSPRRRDPSPSRQNRSLPRRPSPPRRRSPSPRQRNPFPPSHSPRLRRHVPSSPRTSPSERRRSHSPPPRHSLATARPHLSPSHQLRSHPSDYGIKRARHGFFDHSTHWLAVQNLPLTRSERWLRDKLERRAIEVGDIFLNTNMNNPRNLYRYAFVGVFSEADLSRALEVLEGVEVDGHVLRPELFTDRTTGSHVPQMADSHPERRYVGPRAQAERPPHPRKIGLFMIHLPPHVEERDIHEFLTRAISPRAIRGIFLRRAGVGTLAWVDLGGREAGRQAIVELDGEILLDRAVRVSWRELDPAWVAEKLAGASSKAVSDSSGRIDVDDQAQRSSTNLQPLVKNRYAELASVTALPHSVEQAPNSPSPTEPVLPSPTTVLQAEPSPAKRTDVDSTVSRSTTDSMAGTPSGNSPLKIPPRRMPPAASEHALRAGDSETQK